MNLSRNSGNIGQLRKRRNRVSLKAYCYTGAKSSLNGAQNWRKEPGMSITARLGESWTNWESGKTIPLHYRTGIFSEGNIMIQGIIKPDGWSTACSCWEDRSNPTAGTSGSREFNSQWIWRYVDNFRVSVRYYKQRGHFANSYKQFWGIIKNKPFAAFGVFSCAQ